MIEFEKVNDLEKANTKPLWVWWLGGFVTLGLVMEMSPTVEGIVYSIVRDHSYVVWIPLAILAVVRLIRRRSNSRKHPVEPKLKNTKKKKTAPGWVWIACFIGVVWAGESGQSQGTTIGICLGVLMGIRWLWERSGSFHNPDDYDWGDK